MMEIVLDAALRGTLVLLAALAATALMRRSSASARHLVWLAALAALLVLPLARQAVPEWRVLPAAPAGWAPQAAAAQPDAAPSFAADGGAGPAAETAARPPAARTPVDGPRAALGLWAAVSALLLLRLLWGVLRIRWIERRATELTDEGWVAMTDSLSRRLGLGRIVRLLRHGTARVPMTWGLVRPVVLLPAEADGWDAERRRVVLAHELAHVRRWDALTQWVAHLATSLFWFHPLVWVAAHHLRQERERACDDAVLEIGTVPAAYAEHLLTLVRSLGRARAPAAALAMARRSQFEGRLLAILDSAVRRSGVSRAAGLATAAAALACLLPLAALRPAEAALPSATPGGVETLRRAAEPQIASPPAITGSCGCRSPRACGDDTSSRVVRWRGGGGRRRCGAGGGGDAGGGRAPRLRPREAARVDRRLRAPRLPRPLRRPTGPARRAAGDVVPHRAAAGAHRALGGAAVGPVVPGHLPGARPERRLRHRAAAHPRRRGRAPAARERRPACVRGRRPAIGATADTPRAEPGTPATAKGIENVSATRAPGETKWDTDLHLTGTRDGRPRTVVLRASDLFFRSARSDPHRIGPGGELYLEERWDGRVRVVRALPGRGGAPVFTYTVNGEVRPFGTDERGWMAAIIRELTGR
jgi:beta-lactamase regulating signal transducer with metallopeptidase domain